MFPQPAFVGQGSAFSNGFSLAASISTRWLHRSHKEDWRATRRDKSDENPWTRAAAELFLLTGAEQNSNLVCCCVPEMADKGLLCTGRVAHGLHCWLGAFHFQRCTA
jgi:hypothetical protein